MHRAMMRGYKEEIMFWISDVMENSSEKTTGEKIS
jgi:hypothetical protein